MACRNLPQEIFQCRTILNNGLSNPTYGHKLCSVNDPYDPSSKELRTPRAKTIKKNTNSTQNKSQTQRAKQYEVTSFLSTDCELSTETCSKNVYSLDPNHILTMKTKIVLSLRESSRKLMCILGKDGKEFNIC